MGNFFVISALFFLIGCATTRVKDEMLADGNTWNISVINYSECGGLWHSDEDCVMNLRPIVEDRANEMCGHPPFRIQGCGVSFVGMNRAVACKAQCEKNPKQEIVTPNTEKRSVSDSMSSEILSKAKKCQSKGGIWVNNSCQIDIDDK